MSKVCCERTLEALVLREEAVRGGRCKVGRPQWAKVLSNPRDIEMNGSPATAIVEAIGSMPPIKYDPNNNFTNNTINFNNNIHNFNNNNIDMRNFYSNVTDTEIFMEEISPELTEKIVAIVVPVLFGIIVILGLFGNALVVIVVAVNQQMRSTTNILIINLAIADLLFIVFCVPFTATDYIFRFWPFGDTWCKMVQYLIVVTAYASVYTLVLMSLDRFLAVVHPIASMLIRTEKNAITAILVTWIVIVISNIPVFLCHGEVTFNYSSSEHTVCIFLEMDPLIRPDGFNKVAFQVYNLNIHFFTLNFKIGFSYFTF